MNKNKSVLKNAQKLGIKELKTIQGGNESNARGKCCKWLINGMDAICAVYC